MTVPVALIGAALVEVIGLAPEGFDWSTEATWASMDVFDSEPFYQPTAGGETTETVTLACRPHVTGGTVPINILKQQCKMRIAVPFIRLTGGTIGQFMGMVAIKRLSREEKKIAPGGTGYRMEVKAELLYVGRNMGGGFF